MKSLKSKLLTGILPVIIFLFSFFPQTLFSQREITGDYVINTNWDFYTTNYTSTIASGKGYTGIAGSNDIMGIALNPASLNVKGKLNSHVEYVYKSRVNYVPFSRFDYDLTHRFPSFSGGIGYKVNKFIQTGIVYNTENSYVQDYGEYIFTNEFGEEYGKDELKFKYSKNTFSLPIAINYKNIFSIGTAVNYSLFSMSMKTQANDTSYVNKYASFQKLYPTFGLKVAPIKGLSIGLSYSPQLKELITSEWEGYKSTYTETNEFENIFPQKFGAGVEYKFNKIPLRVSADYNYVITSADSLLKDRHDFHAGAEYELNEKLTLRTGFFTLKDYRKYERPSHYSLGEFDQYFITAGASYKMQKFTFSLALMDSHVSSGSIKQTIVNGGISWDY